MKQNLEFVAADTGVAMVAELSLASEDLVTIDWLVFCVFFIGVWTVWTAINTSESELLSFASDDVRGFSISILHWVLQNCNKIDIIMIFKYKCFSLLQCIPMLQQFHLVHAENFFAQATFYAVVARITSQHKFKLIKLQLIKIDGQCCADRIIAGWSYVIWSSLRRWSNHFGNKW